MREAEHRAVIDSLPFPNAPGTTITATYPVTVGVEVHMKGHLHHLQEQVEMEAIVFSTITSPNPGGGCSMNTTSNILDTKQGRHLEAAAISHRSAVVTLQQVHDLFTSFTTSRKSAAPNNGGHPSYGRRRRWQYAKHSTGNN